VETEMESAQAVATDSAATMCAGSAVVIGATPKWIFFLDFILLLVQHPGNLKRLSHTNRPAL
jgi:hypothetical protein